MPAYEYQHCDNKELVVRRIDEKEKTPKCKTCKKPMVRVFGVAAVTFKGNGWGKDA
jgi:putative FmdB family regulatory protein